jgi:superfamily I DNA and/or RNA helicase
MLLFRISQPAVLGAIMAADNFVLVGDHMQLHPLVVPEVAKQAGKSSTHF